MLFLCCNAKGEKLNLLYWKPCFSCKTDCLRCVWEAAGCNPKPVMCMYCAAWGLVLCTAQKASAWAQRPPWGYLIATSSSRRRTEPPIWPWPWNMQGRWIPSHCTEVLGWRSSGSTLGAAASSWVKGSLYVPPPRGPYPGRLSSLLLLSISVISPNDRGQCVGSKGFQHASDPRLGGGSKMVLNDGISEVCYFFIFIF